MNIAICDDDKKIVTEIHHLIKEFFQEQKIEDYSLFPYYDATYFLSEFQTRKDFDLIFLDIEMPTISGLDIAHTIRQTDSDVLIVFITNYPNFVFNSFKVQAFDFLTKPLSKIEFYSVLERSLEKYTQIHSKIDIQTTLGTAIIPLKDLVYITSDKHYVNFIINTQDTIRSKMTLNQIEERLKMNRQFVRCHQSYIVNLDYVTDMQNTKLSIKNSTSIMEPIPISRYYKKAVKEQFLRHHLRLKGASHEINC